MMCQTKNFFLLFLSSFLSPSSVPLPTFQLPHCFHSPSILCLSLTPPRPLSVHRQEFETNPDKHFTTNQNQSFILENMTKSCQWFQQCCSTNTTGRLCNWGMASISNRYFPGFFTVCSVWCFVFMLLSLAMHQGHDVRKQAGLDGDSLHAGLFLALQMSWNLGSKVITVVSDCVIVLIFKLNVFWRSRSIQQHCSTAALYLFKVDQREYKCEFQCTLSLCGFWEYYTLFN